MWLWKLTWFNNRLFQADADVKLDLLKQLADIISMCGNGSGVVESVDPLYKTLIVSNESCRILFKHFITGAE